MATTVDVYLVGTTTNFKPDVFGELLSSILEDLDIVITEFGQLNSTHYFVRILGDSEDTPVEASDLAFRIASLPQASLNRLSSAGFDIGAIISNNPTESPTNFVPNRLIPIWAVAVIVVVNSVIIITTLLLIVCILWRKYCR